MIIRKKGVMRLECRMRCFLFFMYLLTFFSSLSYFHKIISLLIKFPFLNSIFLTAHTFTLLNSLGADLGHAGP